LVIFLRALDIIFCLEKISLFCDNLTILGIFIPSVYYFLDYLRSNPASIGIRAQSFFMAPVTRGRGNRFAHLKDVNDRKEPVTEEPPATYQAHSEVQFASLREQIAALTKLLSIESGQDRSWHIPSSPESEEDDARVEDEDGDPFAECIGINPLYKLRPIGGNLVLNSIHQNSKVACNPKSSWWQKKKKKKFHKKKYQGRWRRWCLRRGRR
jgi:hypothetical protein